MHKSLDSAFVKHTRFVINLKERTFSFMTADAPVELGSLKFTEQSAAETYQAQWKKWLQSEEAVDGAQQGFVHIVEDGAAVFTSINYEFDEGSVSATVDAFIPEVNLRMESVEAYLADLSLKITEILEEKHLDIALPPRVVPLAPTSLRWTSTEIHAKSTATPASMDRTATAIMPTATGGASAGDLPPPPKPTGSGFSFMRRAEAGELPHVEVTPLREEPHPIHHQITDFSRDVMSTYQHELAKEAPKSSLDGTVQMISSVLYDAIVIGIGRGVLTGAFELIPEVRQLHGHLSVFPKEYSDAEERMKARIEGARKDENAFMWISGKVLGWVFAQAPEYRVTPEMRESWKRAGYPTFENLQKSTYFPRLPIRDATIAEIRAEKGTVVYNFCITEDGVLHIANLKKPGSFYENKHDQMAQGRPVYCSGEVTFIDGVLTEIVNESGHYEPTGPQLKEIAEGAFMLLFPEAEGKYLDRREAMERRWGNVKGPSGLTTSELQRSLMFVGAFIPGSPPDAPPPDAPKRTPADIRTVFEFFNGGTKTPTELIEKFGKSGVGNLKSKGYITATASKTYVVSAKVAAKMASIVEKVGDLRIDRVSQKITTIDGKPLSSAQELQARNTLLSRMKAQNLLPKSITIHADGSFAVEYHPARFRADLIQAMLDGNRGLSAEAWNRLAIVEYGKSRFELSHYFKQMAGRTSMMSQQELKAAMAAIRVETGYDLEIRTMSAAEYSFDTKKSVIKGKAVIAGEGHQFIPEVQMVKFDKGTSFMDAANIAGKRLGDARVTSISFGRALTVLAIYASLTTIAAASEEDKPRTVAEQACIWIGAGLLGAAAVFAAPYFAGAAGTSAIVAALCSRVGLGLAGSIVGAESVNLINQLTRYYETKMQLTPEQARWVHIALMTSAFSLGAAGIQAMMKGTHFESLVVFFDYHKGRVTEKQLIKIYGADALEALKQNGCICEDTPRRFSLNPLFRQNWERISRAILRNIIEKQGYMTASDLLLEMTKQFAEIDLAKFERERIIEILPEETVKKSPAHSEPKPKPTPIEPVVPEVVDVPRRKYMPIKKAYLIEFFRVDGKFISHKSADIAVQFGHKTALSRMVQKGWLKQVRLGVHCVTYKVIAEFEQGKISATARKGVYVDRRLKTVTTFDGSPLTAEHRRIAQEILQEHLIEQPGFDPTKKIVIHENGSYTVEAPMQPGEELLSEKRLLRQAQQAETVGWWESGLEYRQKAALIAEEAAPVQEGRVAIKKTDVIDFFMTDGHFITRKSAEINARFNTLDFLEHFRMPRQYLLMRGLIEKANTYGGYRLVPQVIAEYQAEVARGPVRETVAPGVAESKPSHPEPKVAGKAPKTKASTEPVIVPKKWHIPYDDAVVVDCFSVDGKLVTRTTGQIKAHLGVTSLKHVYHKLDQVSHGVYRLDPDIAEAFQKGKISATAREGVYVDRRKGIIRSFDGTPLTPEQKRIGERILSEHIKAQNLVAKRFIHGENGACHIEFYDIEYSQKVNQMNFPTTEPVSSERRLRLAKEAYSAGKYETAMAQRQWAEKGLQPFTKELAQEGIAAVTARDGHPGQIHKVFEEARPISEASLTVGRAPEGEAIASFDHHEKVITLNPKAPVQDQLAFVGKHFSRVGGIVFRHSLTVAAIYFSYTVVAAAAEVDRPRVAAQEACIWIGCALGAAAGLVLAPFFAPIAVGTGMVASVATAPGLALLFGAMGAEGAHLWNHLSNYFQSSAFQESQMMRDIREVWERTIEEGQALGQKCVADLPPPRKDPNFLQAIARFMSGVAQDLRSFDVASLERVQAGLAPARDRFIAHLDGAPVRTADPSRISAAREFYTPTPSHVNPLSGVVDKLAGMSERKRDAYFQKALNLLFQAETTQDPAVSQAALHALNLMKHERIAQLGSSLEFTDTDLYIAQRFLDQTHRQVELEGLHRKAVAGILGPDPSLSGMLHSLERPIADLAEESKKTTHAAPKGTIPAKTPEQIAAEQEVARRRFVQQIPGGPSDPKHIHAAEDFVPHSGSSGGGRAIPPANPVPSMPREAKTPAEAKFWKDAGALLSKAEKAAEAKNLTELKIIMNKYDELLREFGRAVGDGYSMSEQHIALKGRADELRGRKDAMQRDHDLPGSARNRENFLKVLRENPGVPQPSPAPAPVPVVPPRPVIIRPAPQPVQSFTSHLWANRAFDNRYSTPIDHWRQQNQFRFEASKSSVSYLKKENLYNALSERASVGSSTSLFGGGRRGGPIDRDMRSRAKDAFERERFHGGSFGDAYQRMARDLGWPAGFEFRDFVNLLRAEGLVSSYNAVHVRSYSNIPRTGSLLREIGGVATRVGEIEGLRELFESGALTSLNFAVQSKDGSVPFTPEALLQVLTELRAGIFVHDAFPFFSLHFNQDSHLLPVVHPFYENTLVGFTIAILDYFMKCFLNGGTYSEEFLSSWHEGQNSDEAHLKAHIIDLKKYCRLNAVGFTYTSLREISFKMGMEFPPGSAMSDEGNPHSIYRMKFMTSFRIIAKQNSFKFDPETQTFMIDSDFDVEYSMDLMPDYQAYLESYKAEHGEYPKDYQAVQALYKEIARKIHDEMPKLPFCKQYFNQLAVISFCSYLFNTMRQAGMSPELPPMEDRRMVSVPKVFPHIPVRYYHFFKTEFALKDMFRLMGASGVELLNHFLVRRADDNNVAFDPALITAIEQSIVARIKEQVPAEAVAEDPEILAVMKTQILEYFKRGFIAQAEQIRTEFVALFQAFNTQWNLKLVAATLQSKKIPEALSMLEAAVKKAYDEEIKESNPLLAAALKEWDDKGQASIRDQSLAVETKQRAILQQILAQIEKGLVALQQNLQQIENNKQSELSKVPAHLMGVPEVQQFIAERDAAKASVSAEIARLTELKRKAPGDIQTQINTDKAEIKADVLRQVAERKREIKEGWVKTCAEVRDQRLEALQEIRVGSQNPMTEIQANDELLAKGPSKQYPYSSLEVGTSEYFQSCPSATNIVGGCGLALSGKKMRLVSMPVHSDSRPTARFSMAVSPKMALSPLDYAPFLDFVRMPGEAPIGGAELALLGDTGGASGDFNSKARDLSGQTISHYAAREDKVDLLKSVGGHSERDHYGLMPIHAAATVGSLQVLAFYLTTMPVQKEALTQRAATPFTLAVEHGQTDAVEMLIDAGVNVNHIPPSGLFPLYMAIQEGYTDTALMLIRKAAGRINLNFTIQGNGMSALHLAAMMNMPEVVEALVFAGADVTLKRKIDGATAFHMAAEQGLKSVCALLLSRSGVNVDEPLESGKTALHLATENGYVDTVKLLVEKYDAAVDVETALKETALLIALKQGDRETALFLASKVNPRLPVAIEAMHLAAQYRLFDVADLLIERGVSSVTTNAQGLSYGYYLLKHGQLERYQALRDDGVFDGDEIFNGQSSLAIALQNGHLALAYILEADGAVYEGNRALIGLQNNDIEGLRAHITRLQGTASPEAFIIAMKDAVRWAAFYGSEECLREALKYLKPNHLAYGETETPESRVRHPLFGALESGRRDMIEIILAHSPNSVHEVLQLRELAGELRGSKAVHVAAQYGHIHLFDYLQKQGANLAERQDNWHTGWGYEDYVPRILLNRNDGQGFEEYLRLMPIERAISYEILREVLEMARAGQRACWTALQKHENISKLPQYVKNDALSWVCRDGDREQLEWLFSLGATPVATGDHWKRSDNQAGKDSLPLNAAILKNRIEIVELLLAKKFAFTPEEQELAMDYAIRYRRVEIYRMLVVARFKAPSGAIDPEVSPLLQGTEWEARKERLLTALKENRQGDFKALFESMFRLNACECLDTLFEHEGRRQPLIQWVFEWKAAWAVPFTESWRGLYRKDEHGLTLAHRVAGLPEEEARLHYEWLLKELEKTPLHLFLSESGVPSPLALAGHLGQIWLFKLAYKDADKDKPVYQGKCWIHTAAASGSVELVQFYIDKGVDLNIADLQGYTPLMMAAVAGNLRMVELLLQHQVSVSRQDIFGNTALHLALGQGHTAVALALMSAMSERDLHLASREGQTPLMLAAAKDLLPVVRLLPVADEIEQVDHHGLSAVHAAAVGGSTKVLPALVHEGFDVNAEAGKEKYTPLHCAAVAGKAESFLMLLHLDADPAKKDAHGITAYEHAVRSNHADLSRLVCELPAAESPKIQAKIWFAAARGNNVVVLRELMLANFPMNTVVKKAGVNALYLAVANRAVAAVHLLLAAGVERHAVAEHDGSTPLHVAAAGTSLRVLQLLCDAHVDFDRQNKEGKTALHLAIETGSTPMMRCLLAAGANPSIPDCNSITAERLAEEKGISLRELAGV